MSGLGIRVLGFTSLWSHMGLRAVAIGPPRTQSLQNPLIKEYTLNHIRDPIMI